MEKLVCVVSAIFVPCCSSVCRLQGIYVAYDEDKSGVIGAQELPKAFKAAGEKRTRSENLCSVNFQT